MKKFQKLSIALMALFFSTAAVAQTQKGNLMVGANLTDFGLSFQKENTTFNLNVNPKLAYFVRDGFAVGAYVKMGLSTYSGGGSTTNYGVGALARYYIQDRNVEKLEFSKRARFFLEANAGFGGTNSPSASTNGVELGVGPGLSYFITPNVALDALVKYNLTVGGGNSVTTNAIGFGLGFQIFLPTAKAREIMREERGK